MADRELVSEFEARRVERTLRSLWPGLLAANETLRVISGVEQAGWVHVVWELADAARRSVYRVEARIDRRGQGIKERAAVELLYDLLGAQFEDHLRSERRPFTGARWEQVDFAGRPVFLRGQMVDESSESQAAQLLAAAAARPPETEP